MRLVAMLFVLRLIASQEPIQSLSHLQSLTLNTRRCASITIHRLGNPKMLGTSGVVARQLQFEYRQRGSNADLPLVRVHRFKIVCQTHAPFFSGSKTTASVMVDYSCKGTACRTARNNREYRLMHLFYFRCSDHWDIYRLRGLGNVFRNHGYPTMGHAPRYDRRTDCSLCMNVQAPNDLVINSGISKKYQCLG